MNGCVIPAGKALNTAEYKVVCPPSTSLVPAPAPGAALPVTKHIVSFGAGEWSSSGWTGMGGSGGVWSTYVPTGLARSQIPVTALSNGSPTTQPGSVSMSFMHTVVPDPARKL